MDLSSRVREVASALAAARAEEVAQIVSALREQPLVGVLGEAEVGKTTTVQQALERATPSDPVLRLDLDGAAGDGHVGFLLARQLARAVLGPVGFSLLAGDVLVPAGVSAQRVALAEVLGLDGLEEAFRDWPSGEYSAQTALAGVERFARDRPVTLWIDHLETPSLTPRHPLDTGALLWGVREIAQRVPNLRVVLTARLAFEQDVIGPRAAMHQQGRWLTLDVPAGESWRSVAGVVAVPWHITEPLVRLTGGHPVTMQLALIVAADGAHTADEAMRELYARDDGFTARAVQHARTLHRLGGQVMTQVANGQPPYGDAQRGAASPQEIRKVLNRLRLAGLTRRSDGWSVVNPLLAMRLRGAVAGPRGVADV